jgi:hypothetical protein
MEKINILSFNIQNFKTNYYYLANEIVNSNIDVCLNIAIYRHIQSRESGKQVEQKKGSGRIPIISTPKNRARIAKMFTHKMKGSLRKAAKKFNCSHETIRVILQKMKKPILCYEIFN